MGVDVVVVGAGIAGLSVAEAMLNRGVKVCVIEAKHAGYGATGRSAGIATLQMNDVLDVRLAKKGIDIMDEWKRRYNLYDVLSTTGLLSIDRSESITTNARIFSDADVAYEVMDAKEAMDRWPWLRLDAGDGGDVECIYTKDDVCMDPLLFARIFADRLKDMGVEFVISKADIMSIKVDEKHNNNNHLTLRVDNRDVDADTLILCTGAWTKGISNLYAPINILKVPLIFFKIEHGSDMIVPFSDEINRTYFIPSRAGMLVGADYTTWSVDKAEDALGEVLNWDADPDLSSYIKYIRGLLLSRINLNIHESKVHFGPISITPDGRPIVGRVPGFKNIYILDGLKGYGLARAPALAYMLVEHILDGAEIVGELGSTRFISINDTRLVQGG
ncbi:MAG: FAD-binding oxidoreductase [Candidatus Nitrosocaldus sp.]